MANHEKEHRLADRFLATIGVNRGLFCDSIYRLIVQEDSLRDRDMKEVAESISDVVMSRASEAKSQYGLAGNEPIDWHFGRMRDWEKDENAPARGVGVLVQGRDSFGLFDDISELRRKHDLAIDGFYEEIQRSLNRAVTKFVEFSDCRKLLLLQFFGEASLGPTDDELKAMLAAVPVPDEIDQLWVADHHWTGLDSSEVKWIHLR